MLRGYDLAWGHWHKLCSPSCCSQALPWLCSPPVAQLSSRCSSMVASASSALPAARPGLQRAPGTGGCPMRLRSGVHKPARNPAPGKGEPSHPPQLIWQLSPSCWLILPVVQGSCFGPSHKELGEDRGDIAPFPTTLPQEALQGAVARVR